MWVGTLATSTLLVVAAQSRAYADTLTDAGTDAAPETPETKTDKREQENARAALAALKTQQQVPTVRGGTLGIPSVLSTEGLQAMVSTQIAKNTTTNDVPEKATFDLFTRVGGLQLADWVLVDIVAESYKQALPTVDLVARPVLPRMEESEVRDVGVRGRFSRSRTSHVTVVQMQRLAENKGEDPKKTVAGQFLREHELSATAGVRFLQRSSLAGSELSFSGISWEGILQGAYSRSDEDNVCTLAANEKVASAQTALEVREHQAAEALKPFSGDLKKGEDAVAAAAAEIASADQLRADLAALKAERVVAATRVDDAGTKSVDEQTAANVALESLTNRESGLQAKLTAAESRAGQANEAKQAVAAAQDAKTAVAQRHAEAKLCTSARYRVNGFVGASGTLLHSHVTRDAMTHVEQPLFRETRFSIGGEVQTGRIVDGSPVFPRLGFYAVFSIGDWDNRFDVRGQQHVDTYQFETALYLSGHLFGGFDALVSLVALRPYGHGPTQYIINVAPAVGALLGGK